jgi:hypothetical protein
MTKIFTLFVSICISFNLFASDSLFVKLDRHEFKKKDTVYFDCNFKYENSDEAKITLNIIIENVEKTKKWKFRYPLLQGYSGPALIIDSSIEDGNYAITFLVQKDFLKIEGTVRDHNPKSKGFNYLMLGKNKANYIDFLTPSPSGNFSTHKILFEDTARFVFSEIGKKNNYLYINLKTSIDSTYIPLDQKTEFITIGIPKKQIDTTILKAYKLDNGTNEKYTLNEVIVKSVKKKKVELFDEEYATGLFKFGFPTIFDGIESNEIGNSMDLFSYLQGRVAGLKIIKDLTGSYNITWRGGIVDIYLDEFKVDEDIASFVNSNDIAMLKLFPPMSGGPTGNGTIAIYTKRGIYEDNSSRKYNFLIKGYSPLLSIWKF